jgi:hypothetical protein
MRTIVSLTIIGRCVLDAGCFLGVNDGLKEEILGTLELNSVVF